MWIDNKELSETEVKSKIHKLEKENAELKAENEKLKSEFEEFKNVTIPYIDINKKNHKINELTKYLRLALYDIKQVSDEGCCYGCKHNDGTVTNGFLCEIFKRESNCYEWKYKEQVLMLIGGETNEID